MDAHAAQNAALAPNGSQHNGAHGLNGLGRKRRRRRRVDRPAVSARLLLDDRLRGEVGVLSEDLWEELFGKRGTFTSRLGGAVEREREREGEGECKRERKRHKETQREGEDCEA